MYTHIYQVIAFDRYYFIDFDKIVTKIDVVCHVRPSTRSYARGDAGHVTHAKIEFNYIRSSATDVRGRTCDNLKTLIIS